jgi:hypothetical protein
VEPSGFEHASPPSAKRARDSSGPPPGPFRKKPSSSAIALNKRIDSAAGGWRLSPCPAAPSSGRRGRLP